MPECPTCGNPLNFTNDSECPKCGASLRTRHDQPLFEVDVAHSGESWEVAKEKITKAVDLGLFGRHGGVKIIHGMGVPLVLGDRQEGIDLLREGTQTGGH